MNRGELLELSRTMTRLKNEYKQELKLCLELLEEIEWSYERCDDEIYCCPHCHETQDRGHSDDCLISQRIASLEKLVASDKGKLVGE